MIVAELNADIQEFGLSLLSVRHPLLLCKSV